jgi:hypothetical protein
MNITKLFTYDSLSELAAAGLKSIEQWRLRTGAKIKSVSVTVSYADDDPLGMHDEDDALVGVFRDLSDLDPIDDGPKL